MLVYLTLLFAAATGGSSSPNLSNRSARCYPGQSCFPNASELAAFNTSVGGQLFAERPAGVVCFKKDPLYNAAGCSEYQKNKSIGEWRADRFGAYSQTNWETCGTAQNCYAVPANVEAGNCSQGSVPSFSVHALNADHVSKYIVFATRKNLRITIKNTGHDYKGRSSGKGGFALWTHLLKEKKFLPKFVPKGCRHDPVDSIRLGAGVQWIAAYEFAESLNKTLLGGDTGSVGAAGGWIQGGGHSLLSPKYGLGVDHLLEMDIVTPDGNLQTINECSNPNLFWAVRGGGGGSWGVATAVTYRVRPAIPVPSVFANITGLSRDGSQVEGLVAKLAELAPRLGDNGFGYLLFVDTGSIVMLGILPDSTLDKLKGLLKPFFDYANSLGTPKTAPTYVEYRTFFNFFNNTLNAGLNEPVGIPVLLSSRLVPRHYFESNPAAIGNVVRRAIITTDPPSGNQVQILAAPPVLFNGTGAHSVTPVWYRSLWHVIPFKAWNEGDSQATTVRNARNIHSAGELLRQFAPDGGAYQSEADVYEPNHRDSFWGPNYNRLASIKNQVDPKNLFQVWQGVGWSGPNDELYQCYKESSIAGVDLQ